MPTAVRPVPIMATAASAPSASGISCRDVSAATAREAYPPLAQPRCATTRLPVQPGSTPGPVAATVPATSRPGVIGSSGGGNGPPVVPDRIAVSSRWTPAAATSISTCPSAGTGSGTSS
jgi:hypothetical protein